MGSRYRLTLCVEFSAGDDPAARAVVTRNMDVLSEQATALRSCAGQIYRSVAKVTVINTPVKVKLQRLNDDAPPRALVVETL